MSIKTLLSILLGCFIAIPAFAEDETSSSSVAAVMENVSTKAVTVNAAAAEEALQSESPQELVVIHAIEKKIVPLPACDDAKLQEQAMAYISAYFDKNEAGNALQRRRRHFILNNLDKFEAENIANYKTESARPVSDFIVDLRINKNILEENMRLCKNTSQNKDASKIYLLIYPAEKGYTVLVINLNHQQQVTDPTQFNYE